MGTEGMGMEIRKENASREEELYTKKKSVMKR